MIVLAHRGWWRTAADKNSAAALRRAFDAGHGVETDLRDHESAVVVSHDPPTGEGHISLDALLAWYVAAGQPGRLALNIKADGLHAPIADALHRHGVNRAFLFDMAVPDAMIGLNLGLTCFTRESEVERHPSFLSRAAGVWMDSFETDWIEATHILARREAGLEVALVSPELHGRPHLPIWHRWAEISRSVGLPGTMLCTDLPGEASDFFARHSFDDTGR